MDENLLRGKIIGQGMTIGEFCEKANFVRATFDRKISGKTEFTREEIIRIRDTLNLTDDEFRDIFFSRKVA